MFYNDEFTNAPIVVNSIYSRVCRPYSAFCRTLALAFIGFIMLDFPAEVFWNVAQFTVEVTKSKRDENA